MATRPPPDRAGGPPSSSDEPAPSGSSPWSARGASPRRRSPSKKPTNATFYTLNVLFGEISLEIDECVPVVLPAGGADRAAARERPAGTWWHDRGNGSGSVGRRDPGPGAAGASRTPVKAVPPSPSRHDPGSLGGAAWWRGYRSNDGGPTTPPSRTEGPDPRWGRSTRSRSGVRRGDHHDLRPATAASAQRRRTDRCPARGRTGRSSAGRPAHRCRGRFHHPPDRFPTGGVTAGIASPSSTRRTGSSP
ncbi:hypothetical protein SAMN02745673_01834 [Marinactinospora thermotolerans DSM 45154]|uniref:Uncharacterized protein n=1 Tax=Marinactinospora thermotolerans DSM 45154 TaxID=1122192 RepID=A0A1T4PIG5_9ACTN|nr:hypothetical protein SAMN02745673_01834 [Marinactinospora thermotolerans DSM 45154]